MQRLKNIMTVEFFIQFTIFIIVIAIAWINQSGTIFMLTVVSLANISLVISVLYTVNTAIHARPDQFPFGTGRLENASAFSCALLMLAGASYSLVGSAEQIFHTTGHLAPRLGLVTIPVAMSFIANLVMTTILHRSGKKLVSISPVEESLHLAFKVGCYRDGILIASLLIVIKIEQLTHFNPVMMDGIIASLVAIFIIVKSWPVLLANFRVLVDFPLPEPEQMEIIKVLAHNHAIYEDLGRIYTSRRGNQCVIEIELGFLTDTPIERILKVEHDLQQQFTQNYPDSLFRILPFVVPTSHTKRVE
ncbi:MAG: cation transporter [Verrucomicrobiales bacterium]|nr:cation transporter [Verrucomicrobiales bacterium]